MATTKVLLNFPWTKNKDHDLKSAKTKDGISELAQKIAKSELREDKEIREQSLMQLREWLSKNYDVEDVRMDDGFLLRFLRNKKFSIPMAQQQLLKYLNMRKVMTHLSYNLDFLDPCLRNLFDNGYIVVSPIRDKFGRRTILYSANGLNGIDFKYEDQVRAHFIVLEALIDSHEEQILGVVHIGDFSGATKEHITIWRNPADLMRLLKWGEQSLPLRHKEIHLHNVSSILKFVVDAGKSVLSTKIRNRFNVHLTTDDMKQSIASVDVLPKEMGGKIPLAEMIQSFKMELATSRSTLLALDKMKILNDSGIIGRRNVDKNNNAVSDKSDQVIGSFRRLEID
ncbi:retinaldehyde-binding protein 1-like [Chironomus tepperi]|uniref:retinaldehyde-binding protein 1-like n=1 Tax=Chironomus tepperi TaxID=113505 RepID=UPI00391F6153